MCGIAGLLSLPGGAPPTPPELATMAAALAHRGPDGAGHHLDDVAGLAIRRLALVDPAHGEQPLANEDRTVFVVCNGELYDHARCGGAWSAAAMCSAPARDVEVLVHLYEERGPAFVEGLRGMFALALWDARAPAAGAGARSVRDQAARLRRSSTAAWRSRPS